MWLLSSDRAELQFFSSPSSIPGGYAILSHTWMGKEQSFQDIQGIRSQCAEASTNPRDSVSEKIRNCCIQAQRHGHAWVWIDSCCIDKTSSSELSEAINSMFSWYVLAEVCYVYLEDVPSEDDIHEKDSAFRKARWHTRGWTLQELLAPAFMIFMSKEWERIGTKRELVSLLSDISGIQEQYLVRESAFLHAPIAVRMSWASIRNTTRLEDEAYCLFGLFNVNMPTIYGEGRQAFQRLQQEIVKQSLDTTLFAWGTIHTFIPDVIAPISLEAMWEGFHTATHTERCLFALSPRSFSGMDRVYYTPELQRHEVLQPYLEHQWPEETVRLVILRVRVYLPLTCSLETQRQEKANQRPIRQD